MEPSPGPTAEQTASTPEEELGVYGTDFGWSDRFGRAEAAREAVSSMALWPLSALISSLVLGAWLLPRADR